MRTDAHISLSVRDYSEDLAVDTRQDREFCSQPLLLQPKIVIFDLYFQLEVSRDGGRGYGMCQLDYMRLIVLHRLLETEDGHGMTSFREYHKCAKMAKKAKGVSGLRLSKHGLRKRALKRLELDVTPILFA